MNSGVSLNEALEIVELAEQQAARAEEAPAGGLQETAGQDDEDIGIGAALV